MEGTDSLLLVLQTESTGPVSFAQQPWHSLQVQKFKRNHETKQ